MPKKGTPMILPRELRGIKKVGKKKQNVIPEQRALKSLKKNTTIWDLSGTKKWKRFWSKMIQNVQVAITV